MVDRLRMGFGDPTLPPNGLEPAADRVAECLSQRGPHGRRVNAGWWLAVCSLRLVVL